MKYKKLKNKCSFLRAHSYLVCDPFSAILVYVVRCGIERLLNDLGFWEPAGGEFKEGKQSEPL